MKVRDSGMAEEAAWECLFDVPLILDRLRIDGDLGDVTELGCGYGTFTIPIARRIAGRVLTFDIDRAMVDRTRRRADENGLTNVRCEVRDILKEGYGLVDGSVDACLLFNILHLENPVDLLRESAHGYPVRQGRHHLGDAGHPVVSFGACGHCGVHGFARPHGHLRRLENPVDRAPIWHAVV